MHLDPAIPSIVAALCTIVAVGLLLRSMRQPHVVGYIAVGALIGPYGLGLVSDVDQLSRFGSIGVVLLLFFVGMEASPHRLVSTWRVSLVGTLLQILGSVAAVGALGWLLDWSIGRMVLIGFVISLSSTAVVLKVLGSWGELDSPSGQDALGVLLVQDLAVIPMILVLGLMGGEEASTAHWPMQFIGVVVLGVVLVWLFRAREIHLPFREVLREDEELQVFASFTICFGLGLMTGLLGLSSALGAFVGGLVVGAAKETEWVHESLDPFRVVFLALFFVSIGMMVDFPFVLGKLGVILLLLVLTLLTNTFLNAAILRSLGYPWRESLYSGSLLAPIGEFSFVLAAVGVQSGIINDSGYQLVLAVIALCLAVSPLWMALGKRLREPPVDA
ncbi:MAG: cation:proton antiporter [Deltaproteobacteria bacterium]|nr:cation:proton antiporter [Deltaproteobacteria bacterium]MBW2500076.1 cation:proton antiporter [Deltaproteobacteria bacterium]